MDTESGSGARDRTARRSVGRPRKGLRSEYRPYSIKARIDIATGIEELTGDGITRTDLFEAAAAIALRDKSALLAEVHRQRQLAAQHRRAAGLPPTKGDQHVAA